MSPLVTRIFESNTERITIRHLSHPMRCRCGVNLQKVVWGFSDLEIVPYRMFVVAHRTGGQGIGAFDRERAVGFPLALTAYRLSRWVDVHSLSYDCRCT